LAEQQEIIGVVPGQHGHVGLDEAGAQTRGDAAELAAPDIGPDLSRVTRVDWHVSLRSFRRSLREVAELGPELRVAEHVWLLAAQHAAHLRPHLHGHAAGRLLRHPRDVRAYDDVVELEEAAVGGHGLLLEDVDARRADLAALEPL